MHTDRANSFSVLRGTKGKDRKQKEYKGDFGREDIALYFVLLQLLPSSSSCSFTFPISPQDSQVCPMLLLLESVVPVFLFPVKQTSVLSRCECPHFPHFFLCIWCISSLLAPKLSATYKFNNWTNRGQFLERSGLKCVKG